MMRTLLGKLFSNCWQGRLIGLYSHSLVPTCSMSAPNFAPDEDAATILAEDTWLQGALVTCFAYGIVFTLSIICFSALLRDFRHTKMRRDILLLVFVFLTFAVNTAMTGANMQLTMLAFVNDRNYPGGPSAYDALVYTVPVNIAVNDCIIVSVFMGDALLVSHFFECTQLCR